MDPKQRLNLENLKNMDWMQGRPKKLITPLVTPGVLSLKESSVTSIQNMLNLTFDAFHKAHRQGFRLQDVTKAPLAQRRKAKKSSGDEARSSSSDSSNSSQHNTPTKSNLTAATASPMRNSPLRNNSPTQRNLSNNSQSSNVSTGFTPLAGAATTSQGPVASATQPLESAGYFSFKESRIAALTIPLSSYSKGGEKSAVGQDEPRGTKRKLLELEDDDDCIIIGETLAPPLPLPSTTSSHGMTSSHSDALNNNAKRTRRGDTIVIE